jgi:hypothetical protein
MLKNVFRTIFNVANRVKNSNFFRNMFSAQHKMFYTKTNGAMAQFPFFFSFFFIIIIIIIIILLLFLNVNNIIAFHFFN